MKEIYSRFVSVFTIFTLLLSIIGPQFVYAAGLTAISDTMTREKASTLSSHTIRYTNTTAMAATNTIAIAFPSGFTTTGLVITDLQICHGASTGLEHGAGASCTSNDETIAASNGAGTVWGAVISGTTTITFTAPSGSWTNLIDASHKVTIIIAATHMQNPTASTPSVTITTTSDSGTFTVPIVDDDQVSVTATVNQSIVFDLDTATSNSETGTPYSVTLGTLTVAAASGSNESSINSIWIDLGTNANGGASVSVLSANGALKSTAIPTDTIPSATATMTAATANYGICIKSVTQTSGATLTKGTPFPSATCTATPTGNTVGALTTSAQSLLTAASPINAGRAEIMVNAENSAITPAHTDYGDTLTFIATATF